MSAKQRTAGPCILAIALLLLTGCQRQRSSRPSPRQQAAPANVCGAASVCFRVFGVAPGPIRGGRLQVAWTSPSDDDRIRPQIAYDAPFVGNERAVQIPLARIARPTIPLCRGCYAGLLAWGYVVVVPAGNTEPISKSSIIGAGQMMLAYAENALQQAPVLGDKFPAGIAEGTAAYRLDRSRGGMFDRLVLAPPNSQFDLVVCNASAARCDLPMPNPN